MGASSAIYVIGDVHGCYDALEGLWNTLPFDSKHDHLWLTGDLVNRGPKSLEVLRWARERERELGERFVSVLGNHDLHLLAVAEGIEERKGADTFEQLLEAPDRQPLLHWLEARPLAHRHRDFLLVHAGAHPSWGPGRTLSRGRKLRRMLDHRKQRRGLLSRNLPPEELSPKLRRRRWELEVLTRMRCVDEAAQPVAFSGPPEQAPRGAQAWFDVPHRRTADRVTVVFGHWAALGLRLMEDVLALDSGAAWGGRLSALRLEDRQLFQVEALETRRE